MKIKANSVVSKISAHGWLSFGVVGIALIVGMFMIGTIFIHKKWQNRMYNGV